MFTVATVRRQEGAPQDLRGDPAAAAAGAPEGPQAAHPREFVAHQQSSARRALARAMSPASDRQVHAGRLLLGHGHTSKSLFIIKLMSVCTVRVFFFTYLRPTFIKKNISMSNNNL